MIGEQPPFFAEKRAHLLELIKTTEPKFNFPISNELKELISSLLKKSPAERPSLEEVKKFEFF